MRNTPSHGSIPTPISTVRYWIPRRKVFSIWKSPSRKAIIPILTLKKMTNARSISDFQIRWNTVSPGSERSACLPTVRSVIRYIPRKETLFRILRQSEARIITVIWKVVLDAYGRITSLSYIVEHIPFFARSKTEYSVTYADNHKIASISTKESSVAPVKNKEQNTWRTVSVKDDNRTKYVNSKDEIAIFSLQ